MSAIRSISPQFSIEEAKRIALLLYGLADFVSELPSERDQNFLFRRSDGRQFTLKIANRDEAREVLELQNRAIELVGQVLEVVPTVDGQKISTIESYFVRLLNYVPGVPLAEYKPHTSRLLMNLGRLLGRTDKALASFTHEAAARDLYWDIRNADRVIASYKHLIENAERRAIVETNLCLAHQRRNRSNLGTRDT